MRNQSLVSVITPTFNSAQYLGPCIESVIKQTYQNWEMWIVDDCSTDNPNIHYISTEENSQGAAVPRNLGLKHSQGSYVAFLDADDMFMSQKLEKQIQFMQEKDCPLSYTAYRRITPMGDREGHLITVPEKINYRKYIGNTCICLSSSMINRDETGEIAFNEDHKYIGREDMIYWLDILKNSEAIGLNEDLTRYRRGHESLSSNIKKSVLQNWTLYHEVIKDVSEMDRIKAFGSYMYHAMEKRLIF